MKISDRLTKVELELQYIKKMLYLMFLAIAGSTSLNVIIPQGL